MSAALVQLVVVGDLAMQLWRAQTAAENAKAAYHRAIQDYEAEHGQLDRLIRADDPAHAAVRAHTAPKYLVLQQAKRRVYVLKVRMGKACAKQARLNIVQNDRK